MSPSVADAFFLKSGTVVPVGTVFARVGTELATLAALGADLQDALGTDAFASDATACMRSMQSLDLVTQTLGALSRFLTALATDDAATGTADVADALRTVDLSAVAARLSGQSVAERGGDDLELF